MDALKKEEKEENILTLKPVGIDSWDRPVYKDQFDRLWKDVSLGGVRPHLHSAAGNRFEGEPEMPIRNEFVILPYRDVRYGLNGESERVQTDNGKEEVIL